MYMSQEDLHAKINDIDQVYQNFSDLKNSNLRLQHKYHRSLLSLKATREECAVLRGSVVPSGQYESVCKERDELQLQLSTTKDEYNTFLNDSLIRYQTSCKDFDSLNSKYKDLVTQCDELKNENKVMSVLVSSSTENDSEQLDTLQNELDEARKQGERLQQTVDEYLGFKSKYAEMQTKNVEVTKERDYLSRKVELLEAAQQQAVVLNRSEYVTLKGEHDDLLRKFLSLELQLTSVTRERDGLRVEVNDLRKCSGSLRPDPLHDLLLELRGVVKKYDVSGGLPKDNCDIDSVTETCTVTHFPLSKRDVEREGVENAVFDKSKYKSEEADEYSDLELFKIIMESTKHFNLVSPIPSPMQTLDIDMPEMAPCIGTDLESSIDQETIGLASDKLNGQSLVLPPSDIENQIESFVSVTAHLENPSNAEGIAEILSKGSLTLEGNSNSDAIIDSPTDANLSNPVDMGVDPEEEVIIKTESCQKMEDHSNSELLDVKLETIVENDPVRIIKTEMQPDLLNSKYNGDSSIKLNEDGICSEMVSNSEVNFMSQEDQKTEVPTLSTNEVIKLPESDQFKKEVLPDLGVSVEEFLDAENFGSIVADEINADSEKMITLYSENQVTDDLSTEIMNDDSLKLSPERVDSPKPVKTEMPPASASDTNKILDVVDETRSDLSSELSQDTLCESRDSAFCSHNTSSDEEWINTLVGDVEINASKIFAPVAKRKKRTSKSPRKKKNVDEFTLGFEDDKIVTLVRQQKRKASATPRKSELLKKCANINKSVTRTIATRSRKQNEERIVIEQLPCVACRGHSLTKMNRKRSFVPTVGHNTSTVVEEPHVFTKRRRIAHTPKTATDENKPPVEPAKIKILSVHIVQPSKSITILDSPASPECTEKRWTSMPVIIPTVPVIERRSRENSNLVVPSVSKCEQVVVPAAPKVAVEACQGRSTAVPTQTVPIPLDRARFLIEEILQYSNCNEKIFEIAKLFTCETSNSIAKLILARIVFDIHDTPTKGNYPREPHLTTTQRGLYKFMMALEKLKVKGVCKAYFRQADAYLREITDPIALSPITRLYVAICKGQFNYSQMRMAICSAIADLGDLAIPYIYTVLQIWIEVFPRKGMPAHDHVLMRAIAQAILLKGVPLPEYNSANLRYLILNYYQFSSDCDLRAIFKELVKYYIDERNECARVLAIALMKHVGERFIIDQIFPDLQAQGSTLNDANQICAVITLVIHFTKHSEFTPQIIAANLRWLKQFGTDSQTLVIRSHACSVLQWYMNCKSKPLHLLEAIGRID